MVGGVGGSWSEWKHPSASAIRLYYFIVFTTKQACNSQDIPN